MVAIILLLYLVVLYVALTAYRFSSAHSSPRNRIDRHENLLIAIIARRAWPTKPNHSPAQQQQHNIRHIVAVDGVTIYYSPSFSCILISGSHRGRYHLHLMQFCSGDLFMHVRTNLIEVGITHCIPYYFSPPLDRSTHHNCRTHTRIILYSLEWRKARPCAMTMIMMLAVVVRRKSHKARITDRSRWNTTERLELIEMRLKVPTSRW